MMKKMVLALFGLVAAFALIAPPKASAQVRIGIGVALPGYAVVQTSPYYAAQAYYAPDYAYAAPAYGYGYRHDGWRDDRWRHDGHEGWRDDHHHEGWRDDNEGYRHDEGRHDDHQDDGRHFERR
jgi:hypothetical protein